MNNINKKKIFILLPDGIGLRNFSFTNFHEIGIQKGFDITFWNNTPFDLPELGFNEIRFNDPKAHSLTDLYKNAQTQVELNLNIKKTKDTIYNCYRFPFAFTSVKATLKNIYKKGIIFLNNSDEGLERIRKKIASNERKTKHYFDSLETLKKEKPAFLFCTNQRIMLAVAPLLAAQDLGIPTATFIFSWDNLPKASKIVETDYYFVWSDYMKNELLFYYPHIKESQIRVTGTPQFETHTRKEILATKEEFFEEYQLDSNKKYICFSGDDITTSPNDPVYLEDLAKAVIRLNAKGFNLGILFRRCPVDFSDRFDNVLANYKSIITSLDPKWEKIGESWNYILPTKEDLALQMNTIYHSEFVINLGSSMVFDYVSFDKPCGFVNYEVKNDKLPNWSVKNIYQFIHFRSMPNKDSVFWLSNPDEIDKILEKMMHADKDFVVENARKWFEVINQHPVDKASERIWDNIINIVNLKNA
jgi:hypothetical protein